MLYTIINLVSVAHKSKPIEIVAGNRSGWYQLRVEDNLSRFNIRADKNDIKNVKLGKFEYAVSKEQSQSTAGISTIFAMSVKDSQAIVSGFFINGEFYVSDENPADIAKALFEGIRYIYPENDMLYIADVPCETSISAICGLLDNRLTNDHRTLYHILSGINASKYEVCITGKYSHRFSPLNYSQLELILGKRKRITKFIRLSGEWYFLNRSRVGTISMIPYDEIV